MTRAAIAIFALVFAGCATLPQSQQPRPTDTTPVHNLATLSMVDTTTPTTRPAAASPSDADLKKQWYVTYDAVNKALPDSKLRDALTSIIVLIAMGIGWALNNTSRIRQLIALFTPSPVQQSPQTTTVVMPTPAPNESSRG